MACETGLSWKDCLVEGSPDGAVWTDLSGWANAMDIAGGERMTSEIYTGGCDTAIITAGKREPLTVTLQAMYTEEASQPYQLARAAYEAGSAYYLRWSPKGGNATNLQFTTDASIVTGPPYPAGDPGSADAVLISMVLQTSFVTESAVA